ncbi:Adenomatous polyposis coli protein [Pseudolycoriella hygida]|uniref:Adenomatous polyposis coli protein n=1 Tax=Pseudolycoriella hygida TaxID=35572 RepID=A0A9Q0RU03_9DIPT|nr:Adenomatous polyposis coli protein [Pseudolycoriella hygida]
MQNSQSFTNHPIRSPTTPPYDSSNEELDDLCVEDDLDILDNITDSARKPHFLDYDAMPPPGFEEDDCSSTIAVKGLPRNVYPNENIKVDKIYETDGEISDFELSHRNLMKRDQSADPQCHSGTRRKKHFLDENPIPPDYEYDRDREHRSLDRNFERTKEYSYERKHSLDRECSSRRVAKEPSYTLARFLENDMSPIYRGGTWPTNRSNDVGGGHYSSMPMSSGEITNTREAKVECVYSLLSMLGNNDQLGMSSKFLELSKSPETCATLRQTRCIPLIVQMIHSDADDETKKKATMALHNVVNSHPDDKAGRREAKVLKHIEQIMEYCDILKTMAGAGDTMADISDCHPSQAISSLMKISFDQQHRNAMCELGALQAIASLVHYDHASHGHDSTDPHCILLRRYAGMALTNLTFGDSNNKASLCTNKEFMKALVAQLNSTADDLLQATASVLRNLSWRANDNMKTVLNEIGTVTALSKAVMQNRNENTLKALLSALWNLSAHCSMNKAEFCAVDGALAFLVDMLVYDSPSKKLTIIENAGGILRNVSSHIAVKEDYRKILRERNCLGILLNQLQSESLTIVSNACGTLWNLSARCPEDQQYLLDNKAVSMLGLLIHSKHKMISNGSNAALKNLLNFKPGHTNHTNLDPVAKSMRLKELPSLNVRKQRAREQELDQNLSETCDNIDVTTPPKEEKKVDEFLSFENHRKYQFPDPSCMPKVVHSPKEATVSESTKELSKHNFGEDKCAAIESNDFVREDEKNGSGRAPIPAPRKNIRKEDSESFSANTSYQETDLDQITNFSLRYGENQNESSDDNEMNDGNEILLILEDSVKCYETEGTPYVISNAASVSDLRAKVPERQEPKNKIIKSGHLTAENSGLNTPEKPTKYCDEGTPGCFSRYDSFSSLDEEVEAQNETRTQNDMKLPIGAIAEENAIDEEPIKSVESENNVHPTTGGKAVTFGDFETPMMFSRHTSLGSLSSIEPTIGDDRSSVVSEFSRLASGIISPSEIPDSPTQIAVHSPRRTPGALVSFPCTPPNPLRSVFEDNINPYGVENTPAQFSCATSLSNLSLDDEPKIETDLATKELEMLTVDDDAAVNAKHLNDIKTFDNTNQNQNINADLSDSDDRDDEILLESCMSMGMDRIVRSQNINQMKDSQSNECDQKEVLSDDSSGSCNENERSLLEELMRGGLAKTTKSSSKPDFTASPCEALPRQVYKENPIQMLKKGGIPAYISSKDETNKFHVEDSPCSFSVMSELSDITVGSSVAGLVPANRLNKTLASCVHPIPEVSQPKVVENSSDSISVDSGEDEHILNQAMAIGIQSKMSSKQQPMPQKPQTLSTTPACSASQNKPKLATSNSQTTSTKTSRQDVNLQPSNGSFSSDSSDSYDASILDHCMQAGLSKPLLRKTQQMALPPTKLASPKRSQLPTFKLHAQYEREKQAQYEREKIKERDRKDDLLLMECRNVGMQNIGRSEIKPPTRHVPQILAPATFTQQISNMKCEQDRNSPPKNGETTSVVVADSAGAPFTAPDVETIYHTHTEGTKKSENDLGHLHLTTKTIKTGFNNSDQLNDIMQMSFCSLNLSAGSNLLERSNEYPALKMNCSDYIDDSCHASSADMETSNECLMEQFEMTSSKVDKHKDPDLMLKSVDRLTQELVSTAEYLRTAASNNNEESLQRKSSTNSNNTWNEDTCPNDVSFPSISMTVPLIASMNDDDDTFSDLNNFDCHNDGCEEQTPTNDAKDLMQTIQSNYSEGKFNGDFQFLENASMDMTLKLIDCVSQPESLDTNKIVNGNTNSNGINFQVGGEVQHTFRDNLSNYLSSRSYSYDTGSTMTTSTIIAKEANKLVVELLNMQTMTDSTTSLDLDQVRPPSGLDCVSLSGCNVDTPFSPQLSRSRKKSLPHGIVARRALNHLAPSGSTESVNSSCNLDNIKPPSIMDELLDSMISVSSITSEVVENNGGNDHSSKYETALSEIDDTTTLRSCLDLPNDSTPIPSDFSSAESTPKKVRSVKRSMTPRQKRQFVKERYRTYTIAADMVLSDTIDETRANSDVELKNDMDDDEVIQVEINNSPRRSMSRQRRAEDRSRFETQVLVPMQPVQQNSANETIPNDKKPKASFTDDMNRTLLSYLKAQHNVCEDTSGDSMSLISNDDDDDDEVGISSIRALTAKFAYIRSAILPSQQQGKTTQENEFNSLDFDQNSETESCDQNHDTYIIAAKPKPKIVKPVDRDSCYESNCTDDNGKSPETKAIRGKKKSSYVSPYSKESVTKMSTKKVVAPSNLPARSKSLDERKGVVAKADSVPIVTKTHILVNKPTIAGKSNKVNVTKVTKDVEKSSITTGRTLLMKKKTQPNATKSPVNLVQVLPERQGTFIKEEPSSPDVPVVVSCEPSSPSRTTRLPTKLPDAKSSTSVIKNRTFLSKLKSPLQRPQTSTKQLPSPVSDTSKRRSVTNVAKPVIPQRSNSQTTFKPITKKDPFSTQPPSRSNSNLTPPQKRDVTSRISSIWKRSDETKTTTTKNANVVGKKPPSGKLIRSSTFDNSPNNLRVNTN